MYTTASYSKASLISPLANARSPQSNDTEDVSGAFVQLPEQKPYTMYEQVVMSHHIHYYLSKDIQDPHLYTDMIHRIMSATEDDVIYIHLNTPGGALDTGVQLVNAIRNSPAHIVTILEGAVYSLGTLIFLSGDEMVVYDHCVMMFHNFNGGMTGKGNELVSELAATVQWYASLAADIYIPFLSEDEVRRMIKGEDMWMQSPEIIKRLKLVVDSREVSTPSITES